MTVRAVDLNQPVRFHPLTFLDEGDEVTAGRADISSYGVFPADGAALLQRLADGSPPNQAAFWYAEQYGERVDIGEFLEILDDLSLIVTDGETEAEQAPVRWQRLGRAVFSPPAWACYVLLIGMAIAAMVREPFLLPSYRHLLFIRSPLVLLALGIALGQAPWLLLHEGFHALAGRRLGLPTTLRISRRFYFVVLETSLDGLVGIPRGKRYLPLLAGMLADLLAIAALTLGSALTALASGPGSLGCRLLLSMAFGVVLRLAWQFYFFLRTDLYYVATTMLGCNDLQAAARHVLRARVRRLAGRPGWADELRDLPPRELGVARWYSFILLAGYASLSVVLVTTGLPVAIRLVQTALGELTAGRSPLKAADALAFLALNFFDPALAAFLALRARRGQAANPHEKAHQEKS
jgi:hypothetical protein